MKLRENTAHLRILATSDLHMHLTGFDYRSDSPDPGSGLARTAVLIRQAREEAVSKGAHCLLVDNGDLLQGTPLETPDIATARRDHPAMLALAHLDYDVIGLGNHDFDFGLPVLSAVLDQAPCPVVCSNLVWRDAQALDAILPYKVLECRVEFGGKRGAVRVGILSTLPPQTLLWNADHLQDQVEIEDSVSAARRMAARLRGLGCDIVLALAHAGLGKAHPVEGQENAAIPIAALPDVDAIVAGHTHLRLPGADHDGLAYVDAFSGRIHGKPAVMPGYAGAAVGVIDLYLHQRNEHWRIADAGTELRCVDASADAGSNKEQADSHLLRLLEPAHVAARREMRRPIGTTDRPLHSYFTFFDTDPGLALVAHVQAAAIRTSMGADLADDMPVLSAVAPSRFGGRGGPRHFVDIPAGVLLERHLVDLQMFHNNLQAVEIDGAALAEWLEMSASLFATIAPGTKDGWLVNPNVPGYGCDTVFGLRYRFDLSQPARYAPDGSRVHPDARRVRNLEHKGRPVAPSDRFIVAVNSYRMNGGGRFAPVENARSVALPKLSVRDAMRDYLAGRIPPVSDAMPHPWHFDAIPDATALVRTGPGAERYLSDLTGRGVTALGLDGEGFLILRLPMSDTG